MDIETFLMIYDTTEFKIAEIRKLTECFEDLITLYLLGTVMKFILYAILLNSLLMIK